MEKSKNLKKSLMVGVAALSLIAPLALSPVASKVVPNTTVTVQARHHHMTRGQKRFFRLTIRGSQHYYHMKWHKIHRLRHELHHHHSRRARRIIRHRIHRLKISRTWSRAGRRRIRHTHLY